MLTSSGTVRVSEFLEVKGHPGVFAAGDIIDWEEQKQAAKAGGHAAVAVANIISFLQGQPLKKAYKGSPELILIPLGKVRSVKLQGLTYDLLTARLCLFSYRLAVLRTLASFGVSSLVIGSRRQ